MKTQVLGLFAYLNFRGNCEEALNAYAEIFGGSVNIAQRYDNPAMKAPEEIRDKVMHATLEFDGITILASDSFPKDASKPATGTGEAALSLDVSNEQTGKMLFDRLAEGGMVGVPFAKQFWGAWHGNLTDRFGVRWMINCQA